MMKRGRHAVVLGGSMAGLLAARVLSNHFDAVTLIERDPTHDAPESRKGQPQTRHGHAVLAKGFELMSRYFPELPDDLRAGGAVFGDMAGDLRWIVYGGPRLQFESGMEAVSCSRPFLEYSLRQRLLMRPNVSLRDHCEVKRPVLSSDGQRIDGVRVRRRDENREEMIPADLVVDATGRGSAAPRWLEALGFARPPESAIAIGMNYATRTFRRRADDLPGANLMIIGEQAPSVPRSGFLLPMEGERWMVTLTSRGPRHPAQDADSFLEFARTLPAPDLANLLTRLEPLTKVVHHRVPSNLRRHYEKLTHFPDGFLVLGDAVCSFNPVYGQGMTSAALQASVLDEILTERSAPGLTGMAKTYFARIARIIDNPWQMALSEDFRFPTTEGRKPMAAGLLNGYLDRIHLATHHDPVVYGAFLQVMNLMRSPNSLLAPRVLTRVMARRHAAPMTRRLCCQGSI